MIMHPRMPEIAEMGWAQTHYKCENQHNFTKDGELVDVFGNPLKKKPVVKKDKTEGNLSYSIKEEAITITKCNSSASGELSIPATIEGKSVTSIGSSAFSSCNKLTSITISDGVTSIGSQAFQGCYNLTSITIGDGVTSIGDGALKSGSNLTTIEVGAGNPDYTDMDGVLFNKEKTALRIYPAGKTGDNYTIPDSVTSIGESAFWNCSSLMSITIPDGVTSIEEGVFDGCKSLTSITIPDSVTSIGDNTFRGCTGLTSITIPDGLTSIGERAFKDCTSLTSITIPDSVTSIGDLAFYTCRGLTSITIPDGVTSIGDGVFAYCTSLTSITIPDSVTSIDSRAFNSCNSLTTIEVGVGNVNYTVVNGVLFNTEKTLLHNYPASKTGTNYTISDSVTSIGDYAFTSCRSLTSITIPDSVTSIGDGAFQSCSSLTSVTFLGDAPKEGNEVFIKSNPTIYRKPEAKDWGETFAGRPVKLISEKP